MLANTHTTYWPIHGLFLVSMLVNTRSILLPYSSFASNATFVASGVFEQITRKDLSSLRIATQDRQTFATGQSPFKTAALATEITKN